MPLQPGQPFHEAPTGLVEPTAQRHPESDSGRGLFALDVPAELDHAPSSNLLGTHAASAERASTYK